MTDELKNATCSGCGEQVLIEANGQKDGFCDCDPVCLVCGKPFKSWQPEFALIPENENKICEECLEDALLETAGRLYQWTNQKNNDPYPDGFGWQPVTSPAVLEWRRGYEAGQRSALRLFRFDVYLKLVSKYRQEGLSMATIKELEEANKSLSDKLNDANAKIEELTSQNTALEEKNERLHRVIEDIGGGCREALR